MNFKRISRIPLTSIAFAAIAFSLPVCAEAQTLTDIHDFNNINGATSTARLIFDSAGNLYGTTQMSAKGVATCYGGCGVAFKLSHTFSGWKETVLHQFWGGSDGATPMANLVFDAAGNLYGTADAGGDNTVCLATNKGCGVVFELSPTSSGPWSQTILHTFTGGADGAHPQGGLVFDAAGNLYGTAFAGGNTSACGGSGCGVIFELSPSSSGWTETVLHSFVDDRTDGIEPVGSVIFDPAGNLYGATMWGGDLNAGAGTVFKLSPTSSGWTETILHNFDVWDGFFPNGDLVLDADGNIFGSTQMGGPRTVCALGCGVVFELTPGSTGGYGETIVTSARSGWDGEDIIGVTADASGNLYFVASQDGGGTTVCGGQACGTVVKLTKLPSGLWQPAVLHHFLGGGELSDAAQPNGGVVLDASGNLYGTTYHAGPLGYGIVYEIKP